MTKDKDEGVSETAMIEQFCRDLNDAHNEVLRLQGVKPEDFDKYDWPEWSGPANSIRWAEQRLGKRLAKTALWSTVPNMCRCPTGQCYLHPALTTCSLRAPAQIGSGTQAASAERAVATVQERSEKPILSSRVEAAKEAVKRLLTKWQAGEQQQLEWAKEADWKGWDGANAHTCRARARIYRECAADLKEIDALISALTDQQAERIKELLRNEAEWMQRFHDQKERAERAEAAQQWQPIESAPKDGTRILLANVADDERDAYSTSGSWQDAEEDGIDYMGHDDGFCDVDFSAYRPGRSFGNPSHQYESSQPTHWMPLPSPPVVTNSSSAPSSDQERADKHEDLGAVSATAGDAVSCLVPTSQLPHDARWNKAAEREKYEALGRSTAPSPFHAEPQRQPVMEFLRECGFVADGCLMVKGWSTRSGWDHTDLEFYPLARHANDQGWDAIIGHHASGSNPRMLLGTCETLAEVKMVYATVRILNGYKEPEPEIGSGTEPRRHLL